ncbi:MAG: redox-regulated ATPase YchF, partial [Rhodospirillaceae bacterium]|nr:redox-regulated ATPase YchF [Rhodospirillaceae bacterium]
DLRQDKLAKIAGSANVVPTQLEFVDIAGLVKGASKGEGLGNQFLANIREVDAVIHVVRCFDDGNVTHVEGEVDPIRDAEIIETELMLADMESLEKRIQPLTKKVRGGDKDATVEMELIERALKLLQDGTPARVMEVSEDEEKPFRMLQLLTSKPVLYVCNVEEDAAEGGNALSAKIAEMAAKEGAVSVVISAKIEEEVSQLDSEDDKQEFLETLGLKETGLARIVRAGYKLLNLITFFTCGPKETRAWTIVAGTKAPGAAGVIHTDFEKGFIKAETIAYDDYIELNGEQACKDAGKMRQEGRDYTVADGDILLFRFNV